MKRTTIIRSASLAILYLTGIMTPRDQAANAQNVVVTVQNVQAVTYNGGPALSMELWFSQGTSYATTAGTGYTNGTIRYDILPALTGGTGTVTFSPTTGVATQSANPLTTANVFSVVGTPATISTCAACTPSNGYPGVGGTAGTPKGYSINLQRSAGVSNEIPVTQTKLVTVIIPYTIATASGTPTLDLTNTTMALRNYNQAAAARWNSGAAGPYLFSTTPLVGLAVEVIEFTALDNGDGRARVNWQTLSEVKTASFEVERSSDGNEFNTVVATVRAAGKSSSLLKYQTYDNQPLKGANYYRLKMIDLGGKYTYSQTRKVVFSGDEQAAVSVYPTDNRDGILYVNLPQGYEEAQIQFLNAAGQLMHASIDGVAQLRTVHLNGLPAGMYLVQVAGKTGTQSFRVSYQH